jgi:hypothetical protein
MDPEKILSAADCETERTPLELVRWVEETSKLFARSETGKNYARSRQGLARIFVDRIIPLSHLSRHLFNGRQDVVCKPSIEDDFDAVIVDYRDRPLRVHTVKFIHAIHAYEEYLRRVCLPEEGFMSTLGMLAGRGTHADDEPVNNIAWLNRSLELIAETVTLEIDKSYRRDVSLVIVFDDYASFRSEEDIAALERFVTNEILPMPLGFSKLFLLGWSGHTLLGFSLRHVASVVQKL